MKRTLWPQFLLFITAILLPQDKNTNVVEPVTEKEFTELHAQLVQPADLWRTIPWKTSLIEAQNVAVSDGKPIFIWSMDGHPLGCT